MPTAVGFKVDPSSAAAADSFHTDTVTLDALTALVERVKLVFGVPGSAVDVSASNPLPIIDAAGEASLASILAKLPASPALDASLQSILTKLSADPATQTTLAAVLAKLSSDPATQTTLAAVLAKLNGSVAVTQAASPDVAGTLTDGRKTVTTPGTAVALAATSACKWVSATALLTNTGQVNIGGSGALATVGGSTGTPLNAGDSVTIPVNDPSKVFIDARVAGEGVSFTVGS